MGKFETHKWGGLNARSLFQTLASSQWIRDCNHLAIVGPTGTGKSWLACALGSTRLHKD
ncbi:ATP-binding protein [Astrobacterium formosum]|uniref:ATP-binding protein n=1 Tax=Astrobacterium formosum TaxID=3069710 RepID=UPI003F50253A